MKRGIGILLAAGEGKRVGGRISKQFLRFRGKDVFLFALATYLSHPHIRHVILVVPLRRIGHVRIRMRGVAARHPGKNIEVITGGATRRQSIRNALDHLERMGTSDNELVVFHDAVRPFVRAHHINSVMRTALRIGGAVLGVRPADPVAIVRDRSILGVPKSKSSYYLVQSPECYRLGILRSAHRSARYDHDATNLELMLDAGKDVAFVLHNDFNVKLTYPGDFALFKRLL